MQRFTRPKVILTIFLLFSPFTAAFASGEIETLNGNPPPPQFGIYGPDPVGFHFKWTTDVEIIPRTEGECNILNRATYELLNKSSDPLVYSWEDALRWSTKTHPLRRRDYWEIPTTAQGFALIAPSKIKLGQSLNYSAHGAAYVPNRSTEPECGGEQQSSLPPLKSTMAREILRNKKPVTTIIDIVSLPLAEGDKIYAVETKITTTNLEGASIGLSSLPIFLGHASESLQAFNIESIQRELSQFGARYIQSPLKNVINKSDLSYTPKNLLNLDYGFVTLGENGSVKFSLFLESVTTPLEEKWFSVIAIDADGNIISNGVASAWVPEAQ